MNNMLASKNAECQGKCISEMQKKLDSQVFSELMTVVQNFHNDDEASTQLKNSIISQINDIQHLLKEKTKELLLSIDQIFLSRRSQQCQFFYLSQVLARIHSTGIHECACFSEENLKKLNNVNQMNCPHMKLNNNFDDLKKLVNLLCVEVQCTRCQKKSESWGSSDETFPCDCSVPSLNSLLKVHEAILDTCVGEMPSFFTSHMRKDAEYYRKRAESISPSEAESTDSFDVIPCENDFETISKEEIDSENLVDLSVKVAVDIPKNYYYFRSSAKSDPANIVKQSFNCYFNERSSHEPMKMEINLMETDAQFLLQDDDRCEQNINILKSSFSPYFEEKSTSKWLPSQ